METINGGEAAYRVLKANGIDTVFGLLGGSMLELFDAMYVDGGISYVGARDERAAGHMADAWARMTGKPGVVLGAQAGPGVVNIVTAVAETQLAYSPLVVIAGAITRADLAKDTFQEVDQVALFAPICKRSVLVTDPSRLAPMLEDAIRLANSGRRGPVVLHVPRDLFVCTGSGYRTKTDQYRPTGSGSGAGYRCNGGHDFRCKATCDFRWCGIQMGHRPRRTDGAG